MRAPRGPHLLPAAGAPACRHKSAKSSRTSCEGGRGIEQQPETWHYGLVAKWWSEFNNDFRPHETAYFQSFIERDGQPALDVGCGTGRLLLPYLRAGLAAPTSDDDFLVFVARKK